MVEMSGLNISRKGEKKLFSETSSTVQDRISYALRLEIWGFIFQGKCVWE